MAEKVRIGDGARCPLCGGARLEPLPHAATIVRSAFRRGELVRCLACGLGFISPVPSLRELEPMYGDEYFGAYEAAEIAMPAESDALRRRYRARLAEARGTRPTPRVLDVGIGHGGFLELARDEGWDARGVDVSEHAVAAARRRYGLDVRLGTLEEARFDDGQFDLVHLSHVLEHVPDPALTLREVRRILAPSARVLIEVPNELENLLARTLDTLRLSRRPYPVQSTHIYFFNPRTLAAVVESAGLRLTRLRTFRDRSDRRRWRRIAKDIVGSIEEPLGMAPLIEASARQP